MLRGPPGSRFPWSGWKSRQKPVSAAEGLGSRGIDPGAMLFERTASLGKNAELSREVMTILLRSFVLLMMAALTSADAALPGLVAQPELAVAPASSGWSLRMSVPREVAVTQYNVEVAYLDPKDGNWKYPGLLTSAFPGGNEATLAITPEMLAQYSRTATRWQVRARHSQPPGSWGEWVEFDAQPGPPARIEVVAPSLEVWDWNAKTQKGTWAGETYLDQLGSSTLEFRWKPQKPEGEAAHWEFRTGPASGTFENAGKIDEGLLEMPKAADGWGAFTINLGDYKLKGPPDRYYVVVRHLKQQSRVAKISRTREERDVRQSLTGKLVAFSAAPELTTAIMGPDAKAPAFSKGARQQNHLEVRFRYDFDKAPGGSLYPALLDAGGKVSGRNYWESVPLQGSKGEVVARMTLTCPTANSPVLYVNQVKATITDAADKELLTKIVSLPRTYVFICKYSGHPGERYDMRFASIPDLTSGNVTLTWGEDPKDSRVRRYVNYTIWGDIPKGEKVHHRTQILGEGGVVLSEDGEWYEVSTVNNFAPVSADGGYKVSEAIICWKPALPQYLPKFRVTGIREMWRSAKVSVGATYPMNLQVTCK